MQDPLDALCSRQGPSPVPEAEAADLEPGVSSGGGVVSAGPSAGGFRTASCPAGTPIRPRGAHGWTAARQSGRAVGGFLLALHGQHPLFLEETSAPCLHAQGVGTTSSTRSPAPGSVHTGVHMEREPTKEHRETQTAPGPAMPEARLPSPAAGEDLAF